MQYFNQLISNRKTSVWYLLKQNSDMGLMTIQKCKIWGYHMPFDEAHLRWYRSPTYSLSEMSGHTSSWWNMDIITFISHKRKTFQWTCSSYWSVLVLLAQSVGVLSAGNSKSLVDVGCSRWLSIPGGGATPPPKHTSTLCLCHQLEYSTRYTPQTLFINSFPLLLHITETV